MDAAGYNVVGDLFLQNGEDNGYDPEDYVQELDVGDSAPHFRISVADDDGGIPGSLFACAVWNGAVRTTSNCICSNNCCNQQQIAQLSVLCINNCNCNAVQRFVAMHFAKHPGLVRGQNVVEFGAAS